MEYSVKTIVYNIYPYFVPRNMPPSDTYAGRAYGPVVFRCKCFSVKNRLPAIKPRGYNWQPFQRI